MVDQKAAMAAAADAEAHAADGRAGEEEEEGGVVSLADVVKHTEEMNEVADSLLGGASDTHCSYAMGYMRQALYACLTCTPEAESMPDTRAGVCLVRLAEFVLERASANPGTNDNAGVQLQLPRGPRAGRAVHEASVPLRLRQQQVSVECELLGV